MNLRNLITFATAVLLTTQVLATTPEEAAPYPKAYHTRVAQAEKALLDLYNYSPSAHALMDEIATKIGEVEIRGRLMPGHPISKASVAGGRATIEIDFYKSLKLESQVALIMAHDLAQIRDTLAGKAELVDQFIPGAKIFGPPLPISIPALEFRGTVRRELADAKRLSPSSVIRDVYIVH